MDLRKKQNLLIMGTSIKWALFFGPDSAHIREVLLYMLNDHEDNPDFPDHFTYIPYDTVKVNEK